MTKPRLTFTVRLVRPDDIDRYYRLVNLHRVQLGDFFADTLASTITLAETIVYIARCVREAEYRRRFVFVVEEKEKGIVGSLEVRNIDLAKHSGEIGFYVDPGDNEARIVAMSLTQVTEFCFSFLRLQKLLFRTAAANVKARRAAEVNGFILSGGMEGRSRAFLSTQEDMIQYYLINPLQQ